MYLQCNVICKNLKEKNIKLFIFACQVGYEAKDESKDEILKIEMPPVLKRVEDACTLLVEASEMLRGDPYSAPARKELVEGSRGELFVFYTVDQNIAQFLNCYTETY